MLARPARVDDVPAITALQARSDVHWFGNPEHDEAEVRQSFDRVEPLTERSRVLVDDEDVVAAAWWWAPTESWLVVDPRVGAAGAAVHDDLLPWFRAGGVQSVEALARDTMLKAALRRHGWEHWLSSFELIRAVGDAWAPAQPQWPDGVRVTDLGPDDAAAAYRVIYDEARWADVPGHGRRELDEWRSLFLADDVPADQQVLAWRDDKLLGVALGRTFSDGTGWVSQLAVARDQQGKGVGRALLLEAFGRRVAAGARQLGLGVSAENADALRLYLDVGLTVDREWLKYRPV
jgi:ribosomal protein S18 acetylase RimI-like enzyme